MFNKSYRQIQKEEFKALDAKLNAIIGNEKPITLKGSIYYSNPEPIVPWYHTLLHLILDNENQQNRTLIKKNPILDPISTKNGIALILNHLLTLAILGTIIAYFAR